MNGKSSLNWLVFVPASYNDGKPVPEDVTDELLGILVNRFDGLTIVPIANGLWHDQEELVKIIQVVTPASEDVRRFFNEYGRKARTQLKQTMMLIVCMEVESIKIWNKPG